jgi:hypothetical protein
MQCIQTSSRTFEFEEVSRYCSAPKPKLSELSIAYHEKMPRILDDSEFYWIANNRQEEDKERTSRIYEGLENAILYEFDF